MRQTKVHAARLGFTLVELLVVLAILALLFAMATAAVTRFYGAGGARVTDTTVRLVKSMIETQWNGVTDRATREAIPSTVQATVDSLAAGDDLTPARARVLYVKLKQKHALPMNFTEVFSPYVPAFRMAEYQTYLGKYGYTSNSASPAWPSAEIQNAVCLLMILEVGVGAPGASNNELTNITKVLTTNGSAQVRGLVDGYGNPLVFSRVPTAFANLPTTPAPLDTADTQNLLKASSWPAGNKTLAQSALSVAGQSLTLPYTRRMRPVVASKGQDGQLGLDAITFAVTNAAQTTDNKYTTDY